MDTKRQAKAHLLAIRMLADTIRELGEVPSGHLYAMVMVVMDLPTYQCMIGVLKRAGVVSEHSDLLAWIGPDQPDSNTTV